MEEKNKSKNAGEVAVIFIIGILLIALICCVIYIRKSSEKILAINEINNNLQNDLKNTISEEKSKLDILDINSIVNILNTSSETEMNGEGEAGRTIAVLSIEKEKEIYKVNYTLIERIDGDAADDVYFYYDAEISVKEDGSLLVISNKLNKNMSKEV